MLTVVYTVFEGEAIAVGVFLLERDADTFMRNTFEGNLHKVEIKGWDAWTIVRDKMKTKVDKL